MPQNSTALDFAFSLHTDIVDRIGAKVNHKLVPLSHKLQSGDQVEILTSKSQRVQPEWKRPRHHCPRPRHVRRHPAQRGESLSEEGETILNEFFKRGYTYG